MKNLKSLISWIEIPIINMPRAKIFYESILNVKLQEVPLGDDLIMAFFPVEKGAIGGALCQQREYYVLSQQGVIVYLNAIPDIVQMLDKIQLSGGKILMGKKQISPEAGYMALFLDTEGNRIALYEGKG